MLLKKHAMAAFWAGLFLDLLIVSGFFPNPVTEFLLGWIDVRRSLVDVFIAYGLWLLAPGLTFGGLLGMMVLPHHRKRRIRKVCPNCNYPVHGLPEPRCPECGTRFNPYLLSHPPDPDDGM